MLCLRLNVSKACADLLVPDLLPALADPGKLVLGGRGDEWQEGSLEVAFWGGESRIGADLAQEGSISEAGLHLPPQTFSWLPRCYIRLPGFAPAIYMA